jgi:alkaline phosphatase
MVELGLERLTDEKPFFIMCEGGEIDWAAHSQKTFPTVLSIMEFDNAISVAYEFYKAHPEETLIVVTADHGTGGSAFSEDPNWEALEKIWVESGYKNELNGQDNRKMNKEHNFDWSTGGHTGEPVPVYAVGKGAEMFAGRMDNTEFKTKILGR